ncbi:hypothetical protein [Streptomyces sp. NPDC056244]|uniref:hypothetical protein n=1 Tax=unclassified Streptomyces TaxID=2593676 RepID=UPI0035DFA6D2
MAGSSDGDSTAKLWALLGGIASLVAIVSWLGVSNAQELKAVLNESSPTSSSSAPSFSSPPDEPSETVHIPDSPEPTDTDSDDPGWGDDSSGGSDDPESETPSPTPDPAEEAFKAVSVGDCLEVFDTGRGGDSIDWSADIPPAPVPCNIQAAGLVQVTSTTDTTCPSGAGKASWTYTSAVSGETTRLCVTRIYHKYYCVLGKRVGDNTRLGAMTAVDCNAQQIPAKYNRIIHITGVYQAPSNASPRNCALGPNDQTQYLAWLVNDDKLLLCAKIYQGG